MSYEEGIKILQQHPKGIQQIPIWKCGASPLNRGCAPASGKHVNYLCQVFYVRKLLRMIYNHGIIHEANPCDVQEVYKLAKAATEKDPQLHPARQTQEHGRFAKTHALTALQCYDSAMRFEDDGILMSTEGNPELQEHLDNGMWFRVVQYEAVRDHPEKVAIAMRAFNQDQRVGMADHEK